MIQFESAIQRFRKVILEELNAAGINCFIAGGAVRDYFMGVATNTDYDIFFPSEDMYMAATKYFVDNDAEVVYENENALRYKYKGRSFDLIHKVFFATPEAGIEAFDFTVSMFAVDYDKVYHGPTSFIDLSKRQLMLNKLTYPASTLSRAFRYHKKGFRICQGELKKLVEAIQDMPKPEPSDADQSGEEPLSSDAGGFFIGID